MLFQAETMCEGTETHGRVWQKVRRSGNLEQRIRVGQGWKGGVQTKNLSGSGEPVIVLITSFDARNTGPWEDGFEGGSRRRGQGGKGVKAWLPGCHTDVNVCCQCCTGSF